MTTEIVDIADLDVIFLTYKEPNAEINWIKVKNMVPWAVRVDGVTGSDAAHKAAAAASNTERFILIDGDNVPDEEFFGESLVLTDQNKDNVFRWKARNSINGLQYGNGGISCWTKEFINNMQTHEASDGSAKTAVEFCFHPDYWAMHDCYSTTYIGETTEQAWQAGFREGVKMCLDQGVKPTLEEFVQRVHERNYEHLSIWHNIGADITHGFWAILGARYGTYMTMLTEWDYTEVQDFDKLEVLWNEYYPSNEELDIIVDNSLSSRLGLAILDYDDDDSYFFKRHYKSNFMNIGVMFRE